MSLQTLLQQKNKKIDALVEQFRTVYSRMQPEIFREIQAQFKKGLFNDKVIQDVFINAGFEDLYKGFVDEFGEMVKYSKMLSDELGIGFNVSPKQFELLDALAVQVETNFSASLAKYSNDLARAGLQSKLGGMGFQQIVQDLKVQFADSFRRFETEAYTGITQFDSAMNLQLFESAGIQKYVYVGAWDGKTRVACEETLKDARQDTGWTMEEINSSGTPFIERGGYNCRHEWLPWVSDIAAPQKVSGIESVKNPFTSLPAGLSKTKDIFLGGNPLSKYRAPATFDFIKRRGKEMGHGGTKDGKPFVDLRKSFYENPEKYKKQNIDGFKSRNGREIKSQEIFIENLKKSSVSNAEKTILQAERKIEMLKETPSWTIMERTNNPLAAVVSHESGHAIYYYHKLESKWIDALVKYKANKHYLISEYAAKNYSELFAEVCSAIEHNIKIPNNFIQAFNETVRGL